MPADTSMFAETLADCDRIREEIARTAGLGPDVRSRVLELAAGPSGSPDRIALNLSRQDIRLILWALEKVASDGRNRVEA